MNSVSSNSITTYIRAVCWLKREVGCLMAHFKNNFKSICVFRSTKKYLLSGMIFLIELKTKHKNLFTLKGNLKDFKVRDVYMAQDHFDIVLDAQGNAKIVFDSADF